VNLTANWRLLRSFDPLLRASRHGRAIFLTSKVGHVALPYWGAYSVSKAGLEMLVRVYAEETKGTSILVNLVDPGPVHTDMRSEAVPGEDKSKLPLPAAITNIFIELSSPGCRHHGAMLRVNI
jgi:NAD(P)-dependent dehydrogenase (short-subunit alcohol dehydrogenase family)